ncbi:GNAT family N-acetyltransferase [Nocardia bovistercoris]|uniref:GNAT family N-acetyltransferase n=1 Tax=Nocardia bovistercoris TaxID=2785916 RepID=A0A931I7T1_9NOCA|nr:GNAT family N-acetyltransferase [Nocardia bovistercoris]MBH0775440.1 GNAT family N-acetyltransferase [Nocardia bovistercoris]
MDTDRRILPLAAEHVPGLARCHIACWREAYDSLVPRHVLDAFDVDRRAEQWERIRTRHPHGTHVAVIDDTVVGFASAGDPHDAPPVAERELHALYVRAPWYGTGLADALIDAAIGPATSCSLWVFAENPRARAFYRRHRFRPDGAARTEDFSRVPMVRLVRPALPHPGSAD